MTLKSKSIYAPKEASDGTRVLVTRYYPRGIKKTHFDLWLRDASPEASLLKEYRNKVVDWRGFSTKFRRQLRTIPAAKEAMKQLVELSRNRDVTILYYEKEGEKCHRNIGEIDRQSKIRQELKSFLCLESQKYRGAALPSVSLKNRLHGKY